MPHDNHRSLRRWKKSHHQTKMCDTANRRPDWCQSQRIPGGRLCLGLWAPNGTLGTRFIRVKVRYKGAAVPCVQEDQRS